MFVYPIKITYSSTYGSVEKYNFKFVPPCTFPVILLHFFAGAERI